MLVWDMFPRAGASQIHSHLQVTLTIAIHIYIYATIQYTVGENIIGTIKMQNNFWYPLKMVILAKVVALNLFA